MASCAVVGGCRWFSDINRQQMSKTVCSQGNGPLGRHSSRHRSTCWGCTVFRWSVLPNSCGMLYISNGRPLGETAFLLGRSLWQFHNWATSCSSLWGKIEIRVCSDRLSNDDWGAFHRQKIAYKINNMGFHNPMGVPKDVDLSASSLCTSVKYRGARKAAPLLSLLERCAFYAPPTPKK